MDQKVIKRIAILVLFWFIIVQSSITNEEGKMDEGYVDEKKAPIIEMVKSLFSLSTSFPGTSSYWLKVKTLFKEGHAYFSPPNLDFRKGDEGEVRGEGTGEKVKEAVVKSLDKSRATIEDSAKSAAKLAGETAKKVKKTLSEKREDAQAEL